MTGTWPRVAWRDRGHGSNDPRRAPTTGRRPTMKRLGLMTLVAGLVLAFGGIAEARTRSSATKIVRDHTSQQSGGNINLNDFVGHWSCGANEEVPGRAHREDPFYTMATSDTTKLLDADRTDEGRRLGGRWEHRSGPIVARFSGDEKDGSAAAATDGSARRIRPRCASHESLGVGRVRRRRWGSGRGRGGCSARRRSRRGAQGSIGHHGDRRRRQHGVGQPADGVGAPRLAQQDNCLAGRTVKLFRGLRERLERSWWAGTGRAETEFGSHTERSHQAGGRASMCA